ncbi:hypothetical protein EDB89DRAFT_430346 [Lactarius sanguifluus]|nr:hypothetical protein EDB89DRAFT_430346 [Lactarius sanguifluus]
MFTKRSTAALSLVIQMRARVELKPVKWLVLLSVLVVRFIRVDTIISVAFIAIFILLILGYVFVALGAGTALVCALCFQIYNLTYAVRCAASSRQISSCVIPLVLRPYVVSWHTSFLSYTRSSIRGRSSSYRMY